MNTALRRAGPLLLLAAPAVVYVLYTTVFALNVPFRDDWLTVPLLRDLHYGIVDLGTLLGGANGQRSLFPRLLGLAIDAATNFNTMALMYATDVIMICGYGILVAVAKRYTSASVLELAVAGFIFLSLGPFDIPLWASEFSWAIIALCLVATLWLLERSRCSAWYMIAAIVTAMIASFSGFQGAFVWPAGLVLLLLLSRVKARQVIIWLLAAALCGWLYSFHLSVQYSLPGRQPPMNFAITHPLDAITVFLITLGNVFAGPDLFLTYPYAVLTALGVLLLVLMLGTLAIAVTLCKKNDVLAIAAYFSVFALIFSASVAFGRGWGGMDYATNPRYTLYGVIAFAGLYVAGLAVSKPLRSLIFLFAAFQIGSTAYFGIASGFGWKQLLQQSVLSARNFATATDRSIFTMYWDVHALRTIFAPDAERLGLTVYAQPLPNLTPACVGNSPEVRDLPAAALAAVYRTVGRKTALDPTQISSYRLRDFSWAIAAMSADDNVASCLLPYADVYEARFASDAVAWSASRAAKKFAHVVPGAEYRIGKLTQTMPVDVDTISAPPRGIMPRRLLLPWPLRRHPSEEEQRAWKLLSNLYAIRPELHILFPEQIPGFSDELAGWASLAGSTHRYGAISAALAPFARDFESIRNEASMRTAGDIATPLLGGKFPDDWGTQWGFSFLHSVNRWYLVSWGTGASTSMYASSKLVDVQPGSVYALSGTIDARFASGSSPCFYLAEESGFGIGMTCARNGTINHYQSLVQIPQAVHRVHWVAFTNNSIVPPQRLIAFSKPNLRIAVGKLLRPAFGSWPESLWYLPASYHFSHAFGEDVLSISGNGSAKGNLYAHSPDIPVVPNKRYELSVTIDSTYASGREPCFYLAQLPSGTGMSMICALGRGARTYRVAGTIPANTLWIQMVAFSNNTRVAAGHVVTFVRPELSFSGR